MNSNLNVPSLEFPTSEIWRALEAFHYRPPVMLQVSPVRPASGHPWDRRPFEALAFGWIHVLDALVTTSTPALADTELTDQATGAVYMPNG